MTAANEERLGLIERRLRASGKGEPAGRLARLLTARSHVPGRSAVLLELVGRLADRLRADGVPVIGPAGLTVSDLDLWDLLAAEAVPFEFTGARFIQLTNWFDDDGPGRRTLLAFAAHPAFRDAFRRACLDELSSHTFGAERESPLHPNLLARALSVPGVAAGLEAEVDAVTARAAAVPAAELRTILRRLQPLRSSAGYAAFGRYLDRVSRLDAATSVVRTLRCGLPAELVWPEYDTAVAELDQQRVRVERQWPLLAVHDAGTAFVFDPSGLLARYELRVSDREGLFGRFPARCTLHDGRLLVSWHTDAGERGYWADSPGAEFLLDADGIDLGGFMVGSVTRPPDPAEHVIPGGRFEPVPDGGTLLRRWRRALPPGAPAPFGAVDGETGWDLVQVPDGLVVRSVDGRQVPLPSEAWPPGIAGVLRLPGGDRLVTADAFGTVTLWDPQTATPGFVLDKRSSLPPVGWWDQMRSRDPVGSAALRTGTSGAPAADPVLRAAVEEAAEDAVELAAAIARFRALPQEPASSTVSPHAHNDNVRNGLAGLLAPWNPYTVRRRPNARPSSGYGMLSYLAVLPAALAGAGTPAERHARRWSGKVPGWTQVLSGLGAVALRAGLSTTPEPEREALVAFLTAVADAGLADSGADLTVVTVVAKGEHIADPAAEFGMAAEFADGIGSGLGLSCHRMVVAGPVLPHDRLRVVERVPLGGWGDAATIRRFVALLTARGPARWRPEWVPAAVAAGLNLPPDTITTLLTGALYVTVNDDYVVPSEHLSATGLSADAERTAARQVGALPPERLLQLLNAAMPHEPAVLWESGPDLASLASAWRSAPPDPPYEFAP
ncbi:hypothetical protein ACFPIJ_47415 [Dactylosporangium cerinum]|uniref:DNA-binding protein n=1 Tax=Dactylosporangium cerinum TaxID=1434730 RepID=A0ABV9WDS5_9ACTN